MAAANIHVIFQVTDYLTAAIKRARVSLWAMRLRTNTAKFMRLYSVGGPR